MILKISAAISGELHNHVLGWRGLDVIVGNSYIDSSYGVSRTITNTENICSLEVLVSGARRCIAERALDASGKGMHTTSTFLDIKRQSITSIASKRDRDRLSVEKRGK